MGKGRLEAFSDGVLAIIITIMVLEIKVPHNTELSALVGLLPVFMSYLLSFIFVGIYWNNHHHLMHAVQKVNGQALWANLHLLFWLSLVPFATGWMGENHFAPVTVSLYGTILLFSGIAYYILVKTLVCSDNPKLALAIGKDRKGMVSVILYLIAIVLSFVSAPLAYSLYIAVAVMWLVPDKRIEKVI